MKNTTFSSVAVKSEFVCNGTRWVKRSSRTAALCDDPNRWFYFGQKEQVQTVEK